MPDEHVYYLRVPKPEGITEGVLSKDGFHYVRTVPREMAADGLQFFTAEKSRGITSKNQLRSAQGIEALARKGLSLIRAMRTFDQHISDQDSYLIDGYDQVGREIVDRLLCHMQLLRKAMERVMDGESAAADELMSEFIVEMSKGCYDLATKLSEIKDINASLSDTATKAEAEASMAKAEAEAASKTASRAIKVAALATEDSFVDWITSVEEVIATCATLKSLRDDLQRRNEALFDKQRCWQAELDPSQEPNASLAQGLNTLINALESCALHDTYDDACIHQQVADTEAILADINSYWDIVKDSHREICGGTQLFCMTTDAKALEVATALTVKVKRFRGFHDRYLDRKKRWSGQGTEPFLPYEEGSGFSQLISKQTYDQALSIIQDPAHSAQTLLTEIQRLVHTLRELSEQIPSYPSAVVANIKKAPDLIDKTKMVLRAIGTMSGEGFIANLESEDEPEAQPPVLAPTIAPTPEPVIVEVLNASVPEQTAPSAPTLPDATAEILYDFLLISGWVMTGNRNPFSSQSFARIAERALAYLTPLRPEIEKEATEERWESLRAYALHASRCCFIDEQAGHMKAFSDACADSAKPWVHCRISARRRSCLKLAQSAGPLVEALATKHGFDLAAAIAEEASHRCTKTQERKLKEAPAQPSPVPPEVVLPPPVPEPVTETPTAPAVSTPPPSAPALVIDETRVDAVRKYLGAVGFIQARFGSGQALNLRTLVKALHLMRYCQKDEVEEDFLNALSQAVSTADKPFWIITTNQGNGVIPNLRLNPLVLEAAEAISHELMLNPSTVLLAIRQADQQARAS